MAPDGADQAEGDHRHDDERLPVGAQRHRQQRVDQHQGEQEVAPEGAEGLPLPLLLALERVVQAREVDQQSSG